MLYERLAAHMLAAGRLFADNMPLPVFDPGWGHTCIGLWAHAHDDWTHEDTTTRPALFRYEPDRQGKRPAQHPDDFRGILQVKAYAGFENPDGSGRVVLRPAGAYAWEGLRAAPGCFTGGQRVVRRIGELEEADRTGLLNLPVVTPDAG